MRVWMLSVAIALPVHWQVWHCKSITAAIAPPTYRMFYSRSCYVIAIIDIAVVEMQGQGWPPIAGGYALGHHASDQVQSCKLPPERPNITQIHSLYEKHRARSEVPASAGRTCCFRGFAVTAGASSQKDVEPCKYTYSIIVCPLTSISANSECARKSYCDHCVVVTPVSRKNTLRILTTRPQYKATNHNKTLDHDYTWRPAWTSTAVASREPTDPRGGPP